VQQIAQMLIEAEGWHDDDIIRNREMLRLWHEPENHFEGSAC